MHATHDEDHDPADDDSGAMRDVGVRLARLRAERGLTIGELAARADVSSGLISEIERGRANPSLMAVMKLARTLGVAFATFFSGDEPHGPSGLVRLEDRRRLAIGSRDIDYELLTPHLRGRLAVYVTHMPPGWASHEDLRHEGEEFCLVLEGESILTIDGFEYVLRTGDSMTFDASLPHRGANSGEVTTVSLVCMTPPTI